MRKIAQIINSNVDPETLRLNQQDDTWKTAKTEPWNECEVRGIQKGDVLQPKQKGEIEVCFDNVMVSQESLKHLRMNILFFVNFSDKEFYSWESGPWSPEHCFPDLSEELARANNFLSLSKNMLNFF